MMRLLQLIRPIRSFRASRALTDFYVKGISCNSKAVKPGFVFFAVKGASADGRRFIAEAIGKGARAVITAPGYAADTRADFIEVRDVRKAVSLLGAEFYRRPSERIKVVGVTGTNGKTTITYLIEEILRQAGSIPGVIGTVNYRFAGTTMPSKNTTPGPIELHALLARMRRAGVTHAAMEVSSHALDQGRTGSIGFSSAIFTNLTQDHLDYHKNIRRYFLAKAKLFAGLSPSSFAVVNADDKYGRELRRMTRARVYTYGISRGDIRCENLVMDVNGSAFTLSAFGKRVRMRTRLIGRHNVYNILAAAGWALAEGIPAGTVRKAVAGFALVPGRLEKVGNAENKFSVFVDYAHTEDALKNVVTAIRQVCAGRIIVVFGCGGDRDRTKRPRMGRVVGRLADYAVITTDNPRSEDPLAIIGQIRAGMAGGKYRVITDRREAIRAAVRLAAPGDVVLVAGKGHENYQIFADRTVPFDDREVVRECLRSRK